jgi:carbon starvation protein CstA
MPAGVGYRGGYRFGGVLLLVLVVAVLSLVAADNRAVRAAELLAGGGTLVVAVLTSRARRATRRAASIGLLIGVVAITIGATVGRPHETLALAAIALTFAATAVVILVGLTRMVIERGVVAQAVLGALATYVLLGLTFGFLVGTVATGTNTDFFAQGTDATQSTRVYYSFEIMTTTGLGDYSPGTQVGHALAVLEMLVGQLYLVTVIALLVGNLRRRGA